MSHDAARLSDCQGSNAPDELRKVERFEHDDLSGRAGDASEDGGIVPCDNDDVRRLHGRRRDEVENIEAGAIGHCAWPRIISTVEG